MANLKYDHSFCIIESVESYIKLSDYGFSIDRELFVVHPGNRYCRFIFFNNGYLEFIESKNDDQRIADQFKKENLIPGFSFRAEDDLKNLYEARKKDFEAYEINYNHRNYNWKENSNDHLPGWNFLDFNHDFVPGIKTWVTEYEKKENSKYNEIPSVDHKNGCTKIIGVYWIHDTDNAVKPLCDFLNKPIQNGQISLTDGFNLYVDTTDNHYREMYDLYKDNLKPTPFKAIIVGCKDLDKFEQVSGLKDIIRFKGNRAYRIAQEGQAWDLIIVED